MERKKALQYPTITRPERFHGIRRMPLIDLSFGRRNFKPPDNFPRPDSTPDEVKDYLLGPTSYSHKGYRAKVPTSIGLNHNSHH